MRSPRRPLREFRSMRCSALTWPMTGSTAARRFISRRMEAVTAEGKVGAVRIETCGRALCGYLIDPSSHAKAESILINMKQDRATERRGSIFSRASGNTYNATMTLRARTCSASKLARSVVSSAPATTGRAPARRPRSSPRATPAASRGREGRPAPGGLVDGRRRGRAPRTRPSTVSRIHPKVIEPINFNFPK